MTFCQPLGIRGYLLLLGVIAIKMVDINGCAIVDGVSAAARKLVPCQPHALPRRIGDDPVKPARRYLAPLRGWQKQTIPNEPPATHMNQCAQVVRKRCQRKE